MRPPAISPRVRSDMPGCYAEASPGVAAPVRGARLRLDSAKKGTKDLVAASLASAPFFAFLARLLRGQSAPEPADTGPTRTAQRAGQSREGPFPAGRSNQNDRGKSKGRKGRGKYKGKDNTDDGDDGDGDEARGPASSNGPRRRLACPMYRHDPVAHVECMGAVLKGATTVRQHLVRCHNADWRCHECGGYFGSELVLDRHQLNGQCPSGARGSSVDYEYLDLSRRQVDELALFGEKTKGWQLRHKWNWLWHQSCPEPGKPPHPDMYMQDLPFELHNWHLEVTDRGRRQLPRVLADQGVAVENLNLDALTQDIHTVLFSARRHPNEPGDAPMRTSTRAQIHLPEVLDRYGIVDPDRALAGAIMAVFFGRGAGRVVHTNQGPPSQQQPQAETAHHLPPQLGSDEPLPRTAAYIDPLHQPAGSPDPLSLSAVLDYLSPSAVLDYMSASAVLDLLAHDPDWYLFDPGAHAAHATEVSFLADQADATQLGPENPGGDDANVPGKPDDLTDPTLGGDAQGDFFPRSS